MISRLTYRTKRTLIGLLFITVGIGYLGAYLEVWDFTIFFPGWWTMFLLIPAFLSILEYGIHFASVCCMGIGVYFLAQANNWIEFHMTFPIFMAIVCTCLGIRLLFTRRIKWHGYKADGYKN